MDELKAHFNIDQQTERGDRPVEVPIDQSFGNDVSAKTGRYFSDYEGGMSLRVWPHIYASYKTDDTGEHSWKSKGSCQIRARYISTMEDHGKAKSWQLFKILGAQATCRFAGRTTSKDAIGFSEEVKWNITWMERKLEMTRASRSPIIPRQIWMTFPFQQRGHLLS